MLDKTIHLTLRVANHAIPVVDVSVKLCQANFVQPFREAHPFGIQVDSNDQLFQSRHAIGRVNRDRLQTVIHVNVG